MKTPITYYGGKNNMLKYILPIIPDHRIYVEAFAGGAAVFFAKRPSDIEVLNDINGNIANFYKVLISDFDALNIEIECTLHDEYSHQQAQKIYFSKKPVYNNIKRAWAVWVLSNMSYGSDFSSGWQWVKNKNDNWHPAIKLRNKKDAFKFLKGRLKLLTVHNSDALEIIQKRDGVDTFQYLDPPYVGARQGHYSGYKKKNFGNLLELLPNLKSKFLLSSYRNNKLDELIEKNNWNSIEINQRSSVSGRNFRKTEVLTFNYHQANCYQTSMF
ncbi:MAG: DNA adenine methylase [Bacteroidales bacterium]|nr:DNA adenine methylase [Bacteroidales bacterium]